MKRCLLLAGAIVLGCVHTTAAASAQEIAADPSNSVQVAIDGSDSVRMTRGETLRLTIERGDIDPEEASSRNVNWRSERPAVAGVNAIGRVAARALGTTWIVACSPSTRDSVRVKVVDFAGEPVATMPHEPSSFTRLSERSFERTREEEWIPSGGLELKIVGNRGDMPLTRSAGEIRFPGGFEGGRTPSWTTRRGLEAFGARQLYVSFLVKLSENWQAPRSGVSKIGFIWMHDNPVVTPINWLQGSGRIVPQVRLQDTPAGARNLVPNLRKVTLRRNVWHRWEILLKADSGDRADGEVHWWIDGVKAGEYHDVVFGHEDQGRRWQTIAWRPTWGGAGDVVRRDMYMWMAHFYVSGSKER